MNKLVAIVLITGFNFSVCTGGFLSAVVVSTVNATGYQLDTDNISIADSATFLCAFTTSSEDFQSSESVSFEGDPLQKTNCNKEHACITQTQSIKQQDRLAISSIKDRVFEPKSIVAHTRILVAYIPQETTRTDQPLFSDGKYYPRVIVKRE